MKKLFVLLLVLVSTAGFVSATDYWISIATLDPSTALAGPTLLMKINDAGDVLLEPTEVVSPANGGVGSIPAISNGPTDNQILMLLSRQLDFSDFAHVSRVLIDKNTLGATVPQDIGIYVKPITFPGSVQLTQNSSPKFFTTKTSSESARAFEVLDDGRYAGVKWRVNPRISKFANFQVGVSADGRASWATNVTDLQNPAFKLYIQPLGSNGLPLGTPSVAASGTFLLSGDISNPLPGGKRFLIYENINSNFNNGSVYLQPVDANSGKKLSSRIQVEKNSFSVFVESLAIDPAGHFFIHSEVDLDCPTLLVVKYQALTSSGAPDGSPIPLIKCGDLPYLLGPVDILQD